MGKKTISFEELIAKREQRAADRLKIGVLEIPGTDWSLEARMPPKKVVLELYGELAAADTALECLTCGNHALYAVCPQLQARRLQEELGVSDDPMGIIDVLFTEREQDILGGDALRFLGLLPEKSVSDTGKQTEKSGADTVKK